MTRLRIPLVLIGAAVMMAAYYIWHKPIDFPTLTALGGAVFDLIAVVLLFIACGGAGRTLLVIAPTERLAKAERIGLECIVGFCVMSWIALAIALLGNFNTGVLWATLIVVILACSIAVRSYLRDILLLVGGMTPLDSSPWMRFLAALVVFWLVTALVSALMPPTAWDSLMYHMLLPKRLLQTGQLVTYADNHYLGFPQTVEIMFGWAMGLTGRDTVAALVHYGVGLLGLVTVAGLVRRYAEPRAAWLAAALLLSGGSFWLSFTQEYVDLAVFALSAVALSALTVWREDRAPVWLIIMGALAGMAVGVKYTAGMLAIALGVAVLITEPRRVLRNEAIIAGVALLVYAPWGLRGWMQYGNPFYPFFFGGVAWDAARSSGFSSAGDGLLAMGLGGVWRLLLLPFVATAVGAEGGIRYSFDAGLWLMPLAVLVLLGWRQLRKDEQTLARTAGLLLLPMLVMWIIGGALSGIGAQTRLVIPVFPAFAALSALGFESLSRWGRRPVNLYFILRVLVIFAFVASAFSVTRSLVNTHPLRVLLPNSAPPRDDYLFSTLGTHYIALQQLPDDTRVRFAYEPRAYYCPPTVYCDPDALTDHWLNALVTQGQSPDEIMAAWRDEVDAVLFFRFAYDSFFLGEENIPYKEENALFAETLAEHMELVWEDDAGAYQLWQWE